MSRLCGRSAPTALVAAHAALGHGQVTATGTLRFTAPSTFAQLYIAPLLPAFLERHPGIDLDLRLTETCGSPIWRWT